MTSYFGPPPQKKQQKSYISIRRMLIWNTHNTHTSTQVKRLQVLAQVLDAMEVNELELGFLTTSPLGFDSRNGHIFWNFFVVLNEIKFPFEWAISRLLTPSLTDLVRFGPLSRSGPARCDSSAFWGLYTPYLSWCFSPLNYTDVFGLYPTQLRLLSEVIKQSHS